MLAPMAFSLMNISIHFSCFSTLLTLGPFSPKSSSRSLKIICARTTFWSFNNIFNRFQTPFWPETMLEQGTGLHRSLKIFSKFQTLCFPLCFQNIYSGPKYLKFTSVLFFTSYSLQTVLPERLTQKSPIFCQK